MSRSRRVLAPWHGVAAWCYSRGKCVGMGVVVGLHCRFVLSCCVMLCVWEGLGGVWEVGVGWGDGSVLPCCRKAVAAAGCGMFPEGRSTRNV